MYSCVFPTRRIRTSRTRSSAGSAPHPPAIEALISYSKRAILPSRTPRDVSRLQSRHLCRARRLRGGAAHAKGERVRGAARRAARRASRRAPRPSPRPPPCPRAPPHAPRPRRAQCKLGVGLTDPQNPEPYGDAKPGECTPWCARRPAAPPPPPLPPPPRSPARPPPPARSAVEGCASCDADYATCTQCAPARYAAETGPCVDAYEGEDCAAPWPTRCAACDAGCGACEGAGACLLEAASCAENPAPAASAGAREDPGLPDACGDPAGAWGNGYYKTFTGLVRGGACVDCLDAREDAATYFEGFATRIPPYCAMLAAAEAAAAAAFAGCAAAPALALRRVCHTSRANPGTWSFSAAFGGECAGEAKEVTVAGGWKAPPGGAPTPLPAEEWTWRAGAEGAAPEADYADYADYADAAPAPAEPADLFKSGAAAAAAPAGGPGAAAPAASGGRAAGAAAASALAAALLAF